MTDFEKEIFVQDLKQFFHNNYAKDVADEMCDRLDKAKNEADMFEKIYNLYQQYWSHFQQALMNLVLANSHI